MVQGQVAVLVAAKLLVDAAILSYTHQHIPDNYMDEPFHVNQTKEYCAGRFSSWDPKITTFPGLYLLGLAWCKMIGLVQQHLGVLPGLDPCGTLVLRSVNVLLATACIPVLYSILVQQQSQQLAMAYHQSGKPTPKSSAPTWLWCLTLSFLPIHWFYTYLYYTDVSSNLFLLLCFQQSQAKRYGWAAAAGGMAVLVRQTNAVWVTFVVGAAALRLLSMPPSTLVVGSRGSKRQSATVDVNITHKPGLPHPESFQEELIHALQGIRSRGWVLLRQLYPLLLIPIAFVAFLVHNKGVAVGDQEAHKPVRHGAQLAYFSLFAAAMLGPMMPGYALSAMSCLLRKPVASVLGVACLVAGNMAAINTSPGPHPYLLADNRHYTFYVWRRLLSRASVAQVAVVAGLTAAVLGHAVCRVQQRLLLCGFTVCLVAVLVPAWLLEFRYFSTAFLLLAVHLPPPNKVQAVLTLGMYVAINLATLHLFVHKPFTWADGTMARFMW